jgi:murein DD-endopeptidase MepM/ murein hydrolase activator NlpD
VYEQPICPADGYIRTPGYWAWDSDVGDYYWVPGTWVMAPEAGYFWTPGWWGWGGSVFIFHPGYWGPRVGFYGDLIMASATLDTVMKEGVGTTVTFLTTVQ